MVPAAQANYGEIEQIIENRQLRCVFQPLVEFNTGNIFSYEALVRCDVDKFRSPPALFESAVSTGSCGVLGRAIRSVAVETCPSWPLFLNIHPAEFGERWLVQPDDPILKHEKPVFLEITESVPLTHFQYCHSVLGEIRSKGIFLAVDDLGAGYSNLKYIVDLKPEIVKLDRELVAGLDTNPRMHGLVTSIVQLCEGQGAKVVAEGIETAEELKALRQTGAHYAQGYFLARPAYPPPRVSPEAKKILG